MASENGKKDSKIGNGHCSDRHYLDHGELGGHVESFASFVVVVVEAQPHCGEKELVQTGV